MLRSPLLVSSLLLACGGGRGGDGSTSGIGPAGTSADESGDGDGEGDGDGHERLDVEDGMETASDDGGGGDPCEEAAMDQSNQGCEFWAADLPNAWAGINGSPAPENQQFAVVVANTSTEVAAEVEVYLGPDNQPVDSATVDVGQIHTFELPAQNLPPRSNGYEGLAYRIESDIPLTAYQFNPLDNLVQVFSNDASLLFPTHVLATDYIAITGDAILLGTDLEPQGDNSGAYVAIVATEDGTTVDLFPEWGLYPGPYEDVVLDRGEIFTAVSLGPKIYPGTPGDGNLSGSRVLADKPVAVFSGNVATIEPNPGPCCADHLEHQMLPLVAWGISYNAAPPPSPSGPGTNNPAAYRITGAFDGTQLKWTPSAPAGAPTVIGAGQTVRFQTNLAFSVESVDAEKPFALTEFLLSNQAINGFGEPGDPAMIALPAVAQYQKKYIFLVPDGYAANFVTIVMPAGATATLDGNPVAGASKPAGVVDGIAWNYVHVALQTGSHTVESEDPFGIVSVGYSQDVSYGYPGGSGVASISEPPPPPQG
jgi:hypothetical protein